MGSRSSTGKKRYWECERGAICIYNNFIWSMGKKNIIHRAIWWRLERHFAARTSWLASRATSTIRFPYHFILNLAINMWKYSIYLAFLFRTAMFVSKWSEMFRFIVTFGRMARTSICLLIKYKKSSYLFFSMLLNFLFSLSIYLLYLPIYVVFIIASKNP